jgi:lysyl-tRNA synthetase class 2
MTTLKNFRDERLRKLAELQTLGINPYPAKANRTHNIIDVLDGFKKLENTCVTVVGRVVSIRKFGKLAFIVVRDMSGQMQLFVRSGDSADQANRSNSELLMPSEIGLLDTGDFVECSGIVIKTQTGEISVACKQLRLLTKAIRPMPSAQEGFTDKEQRLRRRYVDMNVNLDVRERFVRRSRFWQATRDFLNERGFLEINIPVLEHTTGGADANPFVTHMDALDQDFYLRISHELPLKRLLGGGFEKVYDLGPRFRNENYSDEHLPEHIAMEWYWAYADINDGIELMEEMYKYILKETFGTLQFTIGSMQVDMSKCWERWDYAETIHKEYGIDVFNCTIEEVELALKKFKLEVEKVENIPRGIDKLWKRIRAQVAGPVWLVNTPAFISPLSKFDDNDPRKTQRAQAVIAGSELCNMYSELNDPVDQLSRFVEQQSMRDAGDNEAMMLDIDYVEMLEYGMPPACGMGFSERVFWIFEGVSAREGVPFPQMRSELDAVTKETYLEVYEGVSHTARSRSNTLSINSELASEKNRIAKRMIVILKEGVEFGRLVNAANHAVAGLVGTVHNAKMFNFLQYTNGDGDFESIVMHHPAVTFRAKHSKDIAKAYKKAIELGLKHNAFVETMTLGESKKEYDVLKKMRLDDIDFWGLAIFGDTETVNKITTNFQTWK